MGKLRDAQISSAKPGHPPGKKSNAGKPYKLVDGMGLYLYVTPKTERHPKGAKSWRYDYRIAGRRETLTIGKYPDVPLASARRRHSEARELVAAGKSPAKEKRSAIERGKLASQNTVKAVCERWYEAKAHARSASWQGNVRRWFDEDIYPDLGSRSILPTSTSIDDIEAVLRKIVKKRGASSARHARLVLAGVYKPLPRSLGCGNPARDLGDVAEIHKGKPRGKPLPAKHIPALLEAIEKAPARKQTKLAARLLLLTFTRKLELTGAPWEELDLDRSEWTIPPERMKAERPHIIPLSRQAVLCFEYLKPYAAGSKYVFPESRQSGQADGCNDVEQVFPRNRLSALHPAQRTLYRVNDPERAGLRQGRDRAPARARRAQPNARSVQLRRQARGTGSHDAGMGRLH
jgi:integrase